jgi:hypothetical protein
MRRTATLYLVLPWLLPLVLASRVSAQGSVQIGDLVFYDVNGDGTQDAGEPGVAGVAVQLLTADRTVLVDETTTNGEGNYALVGVAPGAYRIRVVPPDGYAFTTPHVGAEVTEDSDVEPHGPDRWQTPPFTIGPGVFSTIGHDAGLRLPLSDGTVGDYVWRDLDGDGIQEGGEPGVAGVTVQLWNDDKTQLLASTTTNALGLFSMTAPRPDWVRLRVIPPPGHQIAPKNATTGEDDSEIHQSGPYAGFSDAFVASASGPGTTNRDAGLLLPDSPVNIGNLVWLDLDADGVQDAGEPGIAGITVQLWNADVTSLLDTAVTDSSGNYVVQGQVPGAYRIRALAPEGYHYTPAERGASDQTDSDVDGTTAPVGFSSPFTLHSNVLSTVNLDAGLLLPTTPDTIGDYLWYDADYDGVQGGGEGSVAGYTVELWDAAKQQLLASATTDGEGGFALPAQSPGMYRIRVPIRRTDGLQATQKNAGGNAALDSDVHPWGVDYRFSDPVVLTPGLSLATQDVGLLAQVIPEPGAASAAATLALAALGRCSGVRRSTSPR